MKRLTSFHLNINKFSLIPMALAFSSAVYAEKKPNIIVFLVDDMGLMDTSVPFDIDDDGRPLTHPLNHWYRTPNMEKLSQLGIRFSTFYAQSVSSPSRVSLMTGQNATRHATTNWIDPNHNNKNQFGPGEWNWKGIAKDTWTLPRLLQKVGYKTIHIGKAHFGCNHSEGKDPLNIGFDVNIGGGAIGHPGSYLGQDGYGNIHGSKSQAVPHLEKYHGKDVFLTEALTREAINEIDKATTEGKPFYLNMAHYAVHGPFMTDHRFINNYQDTQKSNPAKAYATLVEGMDKSLGDIMDYLNQKGIAENTLIVFLGDNGGDAPLGPARGYSSSAPFRGMKGSEFEGGMRVPFIMSWTKPNKRNKIQKELPIKSGAIQAQMGTIMDIYPTLASLVKTDLPQNHTVDGRNIRSLLNGEKDETIENTFLMHFPHSHRGSYFTMYRKNEWKLIYYYNPEHPERPDCALYNLKDDPYEHNEVSFKYPKQALDMMAEMETKLIKENAIFPMTVEGGRCRIQQSFFKNRFKNKK